MISDILPWLQMTKLLFFNYLPCDKIMPKLEAIIDNKLKVVKMKGLSVNGQETF